MNLNELAREIAFEERGEVEVNIAQIKEILKIILSILSELEPLELFKVLDKYKDYRYEDL